MEGDGERDRHPLPRQLADERHQAHGGDGDGAGGQAEPLRGGVDEAVEGGDDVLVVDHGLAHAHEHDIAQADRIAAQLALPAGPGGAADLLDDLAGGQVPGQTHLAGGAEGAGHAAAGLGGDAQGGALLVAHEDALDAHAVVQLPQVLDGAPAVGAQGAHRGDELGQQLGAQLLALGGGQVGHVCAVAGEVREVVA